MEPVGSFIAGQLLAVVKDVAEKNVDFKDCCQNLQGTLEGLIPTLEKFVYNQLPDDRQKLLKEFYEKLQTGKALLQKCSKVSRVNVFRIYIYSYRIDRLDKDILKFIQTIGWALAYREIIDGKANLGAKVEDKIEEIMKDRMNELENGKSASPMSIPELPDFHVGLEISVRELKKRLLCKDVQLVGVVGMGGSGKTTLATAFCNDKEVQDHFKERIVFEKVSRSPNIIEILGSMWLQLAGENKHNFRDIEDARRRLQNKLCLKESRPTLVVLDDVWEKCDLDKLMFEGAGYKTLITTRNNRILISDQQYEKQLLKASDAVSLFCHFAFRQPSIPETADGDLVKEVIAKCDGLPLALKGIGRSLYGLHCEAWKTEIYKLSQGQPVSDDYENALTVMGTSVDMLKKEVRECFLDMGIFEEARNISADMLLDLAVYVHGLERAGAYTILIELAGRNLVKLVNNQKYTLWDSYKWHCELSFTQHPMLRELAINLTNQEPIFNRRKRLTMPRKAGVSFRKMWKKHAKREPVFDAEIVSFNTGSMQEQDWCHMDFPNIKALILNFSASKYFLPPFMQSMHKLKVLIIINHSSKRATLEGISVLCSLTRLKVVRLERVIVPPLQEYCQSWPKLEKLSIILCEGFNDMGWCLNFPRLLEFTIDHCSDLKELPASICQMTSLERLSVTNCHDFYKVLDDIGMLSSLQILRLCGCPRLWQHDFLAPRLLRELNVDAPLVNIPKSIGELKFLELVVLQSINLDSLPYEFRHLQCLKRLELKMCKNMKSLPDSIVTLTKLQYIDLAGCSKLEKLPNSFENLTNLHYIDLSQCSNLQFLPESIGYLKSLHHIDLSQCSNLQFLPESFGYLKSLHHIDLSQCSNLQFLPESFGYLTNLHHIDLSLCSNLQCLPDSVGCLTNLHHIDLSQCSNLQCLPDSFGCLTNVHHVDLSQCSNLQCLPDSFGCLTNVHHIDLSQCSNLQCLPDSFGCLTNLHHIDLSQCSNLQFLPDSFAALRNLEYLDLSRWSNLHVLPDYLRNFQILQHIDLCGCSNLRMLPDSFAELSMLRHIDITGCFNLETFPEGIWERD